MSSFLTTFATAFRKECKTYCSIASQSPPRMKEQQLLLELPPIWAQNSRI